MGLGTQKGGTGKAYDPVAAGWEEKIRDTSGYHFWSYGVFDRIIQPHADRAGTILDIGCGTGSWLADQRRRDPSRSLVGIDISHQIAKTAKSHCGCLIVVGDADRQPFKNDAFDLVVSRGDAVTQAYDPLEAFSEVHRVLVPGGRVCFEMGWSLTPFEGLCREDGEAMYRKDTIHSGDVDILIMTRYRLPGDLRTRADGELGDQEHHPTRWNAAELAKATSVEERHLLVGGESNIQRVLSGVGLTLEGIHGTGVLGWLVSTKRLPQEVIHTLATQADIAIEVAAALSRHTDPAESQRVTIIANKNRQR